MDTKIDFPLRPAGPAIMLTAPTHAVSGFAEPEPPSGPRALPGSPPGPGDAAAGGAAETAPAESVEALVGLPLATVERALIEATIRSCGGSLPRAAKVLGVSPSTLYRKRAAWHDR